MAATEQLPRVTRTAVALGLLWLVDSVFMGQGLFSLLVSVVGLGLLTLAALWALLRGQRARAGNRAVRAALYVLLGAATAGAMRFHAHTARTHAARVIDACRAYERAHGKLPDRLQDLVPGFLGAVPRAKYTGMFGEFTYWSAPAGHTLLYVELPPFGRRLYHFEQDRWGRLD